MARSHYEKFKKTLDIVAAIKDKDTFGNLPAFSSLATWLGWLAWLKSVFALPMYEGKQASTFQSGLHRVIR